MAPGATTPQISVVLPCLDEEAGLAVCIGSIRKAFADGGLDGEVVVCDNGSTDRSLEIARAAGVVVVQEPKKGYGLAYGTGLAAARGAILVMGDADDTYDFALIPTLVAGLRDGRYDFVTGSRYLDKAGSREIPWSHRLFGNPLLTGLLNLLFGTRYTDVYCGFRAFTRAAYERIRPVSPGMEWNLELAINAGRAGLRIQEIPIRLRERKGVSKLRTLRDGWRSLRMMLLYSPTKVFVWPGLALLLFGLLVQAVVLAGVVHHQGRVPGIVTGSFGGMFAILGFNILSLGLHAKTYSWSRRFEENQALAAFYDRFDFERGLLLGAGVLLAGGIALGGILTAWVRSGFQALAHPEWVPVATTLVVLGCQIVFSSLFISAMSVSKAESTPYSG
jgi:glycosyltransferase involved in cell wall biosynthesis